jgi:hypothetical protein
MMSPVRRLFPFQQPCGPFEGHDSSDRMHAGHFADTLDTWRAADHVDARQKESTS